MIPGGPEWMKKVEELHDFPVVMALYLPSDKRALHSRVIETKAQRIGSIPYDKVAPDLLLEGDFTIALLDVKRIHSAQEYWEWSQEYKKLWGLDYL